MTRETLELVHYGLLGSCLTHRTVSMEPNQIRLIDEARGGSAAAFEALVRQHKGSSGPSACASPGTPTMPRTPCRTR